MQRTQIEAACAYMLMASVLLLVSPITAADKPKTLTIWDCETTADIDGLSLETTLVKQGATASP